MGESFEEDVGDVCSWNGGRKIEVERLREWSCRVIKREIRKRKRDGMFEREVVLKYFVLNYF